MVGRGTHRYLKLGLSQIQLRTPAMDTTHKGTAAPPGINQRMIRPSQLGNASLPQYDSGALGRVPLRAQQRSADIFPGRPAFQL